MGENERGFRWNIDQTVARRFEIVEPLYSDPEHGELYRARTESSALAVNVRWIPAVPAEAVDKFKNLHELASRYLVNPIDAIQVSNLG